MGAERVDQIWCCQVLVAAVYTLLFLRFTVNSPVAEATVLFLRIEGFQFLMCFGILGWLLIVGLFVDKGAKWQKFVFFVFNFMVV